MVPLIITLALISLLIAFLIARLFMIGKPVVVEDLMKSQTVLIPNETPGESAILRNPVSRLELTRFWDPNIRTLHDAFETIVAKYPNRIYLGRRVSKTFVWETYSQIAKRRAHFGSGIRNLGIDPGDALGIYSINRPEWLITDLACHAYSFISVALYDTLGKNAVEHILNDSRIKIVVCSGERVSRMISITKVSQSLRIIISMDRITPEQIADAQSAGIQLFYFKDVELDGEKNPRHLVPPLPSDVTTIMYTSGTTGLPKGVEITHTNMIGELAGVSQAGLSFTCEDVHFSYLPLAHCFERIVVHTALFCGFSIGFYQGVISKLFDDIKVLKPTFLVGAPRVWSRLHDKMWQAVNAKRASENKLVSYIGGVVWRTLFRYAFEKKRLALRQGRRSARIWDILVFNKIRDRLVGGGHHARLRFILSGSAPLDPQIAEFLLICFCCPVLQGYGLTETSAGACVTDMRDCSVGHVGRPLSCNEIKLVDVPEMNYFANDNAGEIYIRGSNVFQAYHRDPQASIEALTSDEWLRTGDIGRINANGTISIVDRVKNLFKLEQGEYVAAEYLERIFQRSKFVSQIFVHGDSFKSWLVAVVIPNEEAVQTWARKHNIKEKSLPVLCRNEHLIQSILKDLHAIGKEAHLKNFEFLRAILLEPKSFTDENDMLTPTFKLRRHLIRQRYSAQFQKLYECTTPQLTESE